MIHKNYMDDSENITLIDNDIDEFLKKKGKDYTFWIDRHLLWDWKHRIYIDLWKETKTIDINAWDNKEYLYEVLEDIIS